MAAKRLSVSLSADVHKCIVEAALILECSPGDIITQTFMGNPPPNFDSLSEALKQEAAELQKLDELSLWQIAQGYKSSILEQQLLQIRENRTQLQTLPITEESDSAVENFELNIERRALAMALLKWRGASI